MSVYRRKYRDKDGRLRVSQVWTVEAHVDGMQVRVSGTHSKRTSEDLERRVRRLLEIQVTGGELDPEMQRWLGSITNQLRDQLARQGLVHGRAAAATRPLEDHIADYRLALLDGVATARQRRPVTLKHAELAEERLRRLVDGVGAAFACDVTPEAVGRWLTEQRQQGMSVVTSNHYLTRAKAFLTWMVRAGRATSNPLGDVARQQVLPRQATFVRRALSADEAQVLLRHVHGSSGKHRMSGPDRYWAYRLALECALRVGDLRSLTPSHFVLDVDEPFLLIEPDDSKNRVGAELPLRPETVEELLKYLKGRPKGKPLFRLPYHCAEVLQRDMSAARLAWIAQVPEGRPRAERERSGFLVAERDGAVVDFHALRTTSLSWFAAAGVPVKTLQTLARHSTPTLTMKSYARVLGGGLAQAAERLPDLAVGPAPQREQQRATGTEGAAPVPPPTGGRTGGRNCTEPAKTGSDEPRGEVAGLAAGGSQVIDTHGFAVTGVDGNRTHQTLWVQRLNGFEDRGGEAVSADGSKQLGEGPPSTGGPTGGRFSPELALIVRHWDALSPAARAQILRIVQSTTGVRK